MKKIIFLIFLLAGLTNSFAQTNKADKVSILFVGTYHFNSSGADLVNPDVDDVLSAKRQKEIAEVNALLKKFAPTKIGIEQTPENEIIGERYQLFVQGKYEPGRNEIYQIAFRLGKDAGHQKLYQIDSGGTFPFGAVEDFAKISGQKSLMDELTQGYQKSNEEFNAKLKTSTVRDLLLFLNEPQQIDKDQAAYLQLAKIGAGRVYPGVDLLTAWYERNLKIFANITRMENQPKDRVLILIGAGHLALLRQFAKESGEYKVEDLKDYLSK